MRVDLRAATGAAVTLLMGAGLLVAGPSGAAGAAGPGDPGAVLVEQKVELTAANRVAGMPASSDPGRQVERATVTVELYPDGTRDWLKARVDLVDNPAPNPGQYDDNAVLVVGYGHLTGSNCEVGVVQTKRTGPHAWQYELLDWVGEDGHGKVGERPDKPFDCVLVALESLDGQETYDAMVATPVNTWAAPQLKLGKVSQLGATQKKLKLVRGQWTPYTVTVRNTGDRPVSALSLTGKGKGLKVRKGRHDFEVGPGESATLSFKVRLKGKWKKAQLRLTADDGDGVRAVRKVQVRRTKPPRRPVDGSYRDKSGDIRFKIRKRRIVGFRVSTVTECGTYLNKTRTNNTYDFPRKKIPRNGILDARQEGKASDSRWSAALSFKAAGRKVTRGSFRYHFHTPGVIGSSCSASEKFTAKRVGR